eukprot:TRINITY_DN11581_c0_g1_i2.p1 TRINITY_DN11581_c0_g1~~TRINITY_DN11581_c0_g1_i2.p1  ORF type:complete len:258 (+),score=85.77 TRINITY_DN11581_c0_g1_i2:908-1681(+)
MLLCVVRKVRRWDQRAWEAREAGERRWRSCGRRGYLMGLFEVEEPWERYGRVLEGCYGACQVSSPVDWLCRIEGKTFEVVEKRKEGKKRRAGMWKPRKVSADKFYHIVMEIEGKEGEMGESVFPVLVYSRVPKRPYPVKVITDMRRVGESEYKELEAKEKKYRQVFCGKFSGKWTRSLESDPREIAYQLFLQVPKEFPERNQLMFAMSEITEEVSTVSNFFDPDPPLTERQLKENFIRGMISRFPTLSYLFNPTNIQ